ncbi:CheR family methyltransferase [Roseateles chitosanitabidus]|uniref:CheR family methyltransferase n=1 Tax=Roseateles chitosanitabidus TaxID=65048 RepID=UPI00082D00D9|nr:CheR family methyltransferase [Roseateles chitosanitabidus]MBO9687240.1 chemotaxis protein CheR [Roseateles chitosanitabidus]
MRPGQPASVPASSPVEAIDHEFSFSRADFDRVRQLIYQHAGISLHDGKHAMVYSRLSRRLRDTGHKSFASYLQWLEGVTGPQGDQEWQEFVNCLTTNLTSFFREDHHFQSLTDDLKTLQGKPIRIWCCAASTGEEPYSIAMTCQESLGANSGVQIICSDIDTNVLNTARRGVYAAESRGLSPQRLRQFFLKGTGANEGRIRVKPELARMIEFRTLNLMNTSWNLGEPFHVVFCRNVMIYFDAPTQRKVLERIHKVMRPGGLLFVGHSENFTDSRDLFRLRGKTIYERV